MLSREQQLKQYTQEFRALANVNRLKIISLLGEYSALSVSDIADKIGISFKATSKHLIMLENLRVLVSDGRSGHVFYSLNADMPGSVRQAIRFVVKFLP